MLAALALAFGLAMDATAVCAARALGAQSRRELAILPLLFGAFQAGMAAVGWLGGRAAASYIADWDHIVAFVLLVAIGVHMIVEAVRDRGGEVPLRGTLGPGSGSSSLRADEPAIDRPRVREGTPVVYLALAVATSIDAAAAGLTLHLVPVAPWLVLTAIGVVTAACCAVGYALGRALGRRVGPLLGVVGGLILVAIGVDMLIRAP